MRRLLLPLALLACNGPDDDPSVPDETTDLDPVLAEATLDADGGTLSAEGVQVTVPAGALGDALTMSIVAADPARFAGLPTAAGPMIDLEPSYTTFQTPIEVCLAPPDDGVERVVVTYGYNGWTPLALPRTTEDGLICGSTDHLSPFGLAVRDCGVMVCDAWPPDGLRPSDQVLPLPETGAARLLTPTTEVDEGDPLTVVVERVGDTSSSMTVTLRTVDGELLAGRHYDAFAAELSWPAGDATSRTVTIATNDDHTETSGSFWLTLDDGPVAFPAVQRVDVIDDEAHGRRSLSVVGGDTFVALPDVTPSRKLVLQWGEDEPPETLSVVSRAVGASARTQATRVRDLVWGTDTTRVIDVFDDGIVSDPTDIQRHEMWEVSFHTDPPVHPVPTITLVAGPYGWQGDGARIIPSATIDTAISAFESFSVSVERTGPPSGPLHMKLACLGMGPVASSARVRDGQVQQGWNVGVPPCRADQLQHQSGLDDLYWGAGQMGLRTVQVDVRGSLDAEYTLRDYPNQQSGRLYYGLVPADTPENATVYDPPLGSIPLGRNVDSIGYQLRFPEEARLSMDKGKATLGMFCPYDTVRPVEVIVGAPYTATPSTFDFCGDDKSVQDVVITWDGTNPPESGRITVIVREVGARGIAVIDSIFPPGPIAVGPDPIPFEAAGFASAEQVLAEQGAFSVTVSREAPDPSVATLPRSGYTWWHADDPATDPLDDADGRLPWSFGIGLLETSVSGTMVPDPLRTGDRAGWMAMSLASPTQLLMPYWATRVRVRDEEAAQQPYQGIRAVAYRDVDGDGRWDIDEDAVPDWTATILLDGSEIAAGQGMVVAEPLAAGAYTVRFAAGPGALLQPIGSATTERTITVPEDGGLLDVILPLHGVGGLRVRAYADLDGDHTLSNATEADMVLPIDVKEQGGALQQYYTGDGVVALAAAPNTTYTFTAVPPFPAAVAHEPFTGTTSVFAYDMTGVSNVHVSSTVEVQVTVAEDRGIPGVLDAADVPVPGAAVKLVPEVDWLVEREAVTNSAGVAILNGVWPTSYTAITANPLYIGDVEAWFHVPQDTTETLEVVLLVSQPAQVVTRTFVDLDLDGVHDLNELAPNVKPRLFANPGLVEVSPEGAGGLGAWGDLVPQAYETYLPGTDPSGEYHLLDGSSFEHFTLASGEHREREHVYGAATATSGRVFLDVDGTGTWTPGDTDVEDVTVSVYADEDGDGTFTDLLASTTTDAHGSWWVADLPPGLLELVWTDLPTGQLPERPSRRRIFLTSIQPGQDLPLGVSGTLTVSAFHDTDGDGAQGAGETAWTGLTASVRRFEDEDDAEGTPVASGVLDANGEASFPLPPGHYRVALASTGSAFTILAPTAGANPRDLVLAGDRAEVFGFGDGVLVSGLVFDDRDGDGIQDPGEGSPPDTRVYIGAAADLAPNADGTWAAWSPATVVGLRVEPPWPGTFTVGDPQTTLILSGATTAPTVGYQRWGEVGVSTFVDEDGDGLRGPDERGVRSVRLQILPDADGDGVGDGTVSTQQHTDPAGDWPVFGMPPGRYLLHLEPGQSWIAADVPFEADADAPVLVEMPIVQSASLVGEIFDDLDGDGVPEAGEPGLAGTVEVAVSGADTWVTLATLTADADGSWSLPDLAPGFVRVRVEPPAAGPAVPTTPTEVVLHLLSGGTGIAPAVGFTAEGGPGDTDAPTDTGWTDPPPLGTDTGSTDVLDSPPAPSDTGLTDDETSDGPSDTGSDLLDSPPAPSDTDTGRTVVEHSDTDTGRTVVEHTDTGATDAEPSDTGSSDITPSDTGASDTEPTDVSDGDTGFTDAPGGFVVSILADAIGMPFLGRIEHLDGGRGFGLDLGDHPWSWERGTEPQLLDPPLGASSWVAWSARAGLPSGWYDQGASRIPIWWDEGGQVHEITNGPSAAPYATMARGDTVLLTETGVRLMHGATSEASIPAWLMQSGGAAVPVYCDPSYPYCTIADLTDDGGAIGYAFDGIYDLAVRWTSDGVQEELPPPPGVDTRWRPARSAGSWIAGRLYSTGELVLHDGTDTTIIPNPPGTDLFYVVDVTPEGRTLCEMSGQTGLEVWIHDPIEGWVDATPSGVPNGFTFVGVTLDPTGWLVGGGVCAWWGCNAATSRPVH